MKRFFYVLNTRINKVKAGISFLLVLFALQAHAADPLQITFETSGGSFEVCQGIRFTITGYANGGTGEYSDYSWTAAPGMIFNTTFDDVVVFNTDYFTAPGNYAINLTVTDTEGNTGTGSITIQLKKTDRVSISTGDATTFCAPGSALLVADPADGFSYQWRLNLVNIPGAEAFSYEATQS
ncbi:MAG: hypothetical protein R6U64_03300, partial [Bacteroidales bacterium]